MSDIQSASPTHHDHEIQAAKMQALDKMIWLITLIAGAISVIVVVSVVIIAIAQIVIGKTTPNGFVMPDVLVNWGGIILGFYFGQFVTLLKDYMGVVPRPTPTGPRPTN